MQNSQEIACRLDDVKQAKTIESKGKTFHIVEMNVTELNTGLLYHVSCFTRGKPFMWEDGQEVIMPIKAGKQYQGVTQYSTNLMDIIPLDAFAKKHMPDLPKAAPPLPETPKDDSEQKMWADKERRDFRGRCIMYAMETVKLRYRDEKMQLRDLVGVIKKTADGYFQYIYGIK